LVVVLSLGLLDEVVTLALQVNLLLPPLLPLPQDLLPLPPLVRGHLRDLDRKSKVYPFFL
jgi:hypothetical protein